MKEPREIQKSLENYADAATKDLGVPGISLAVYKNGKVYKVASGILNTDTGVRATTDSIFQIGSITKVFTASLIMMLVEKGQVLLENPLKYYLSGFQIADREATESITVAQLLNHTSGIAGDYATDDLKEDGPHIARYVDRCSQLPLIHPVGSGVSYSNSAFAMAGRLIEVILGKSWFDAMEEHIFMPLRMKHSICRPQDSLRFRTAIGHSVGSDGENETVTDAYLSFGLSPAGSTTSMTAADLVTFGRAHLDGGLNISGERWLEPRSIRLMQEQTIKTPSSFQEVESAVGLGWGLGKYKATGLSFFGHSGSTSGQCSQLRVFPDNRACIAVLLNCANLNILSSISNQLTRLVTGFNPDASISRRSPKMCIDNLEAYVGNYQSYAGTYRIELVEGQLIENSTKITDKKGKPNMIFLACGNGCFERINSGGVSMGLVYFLSPNGKGVCQQFYADGRLFQRI